MKGKPKQPVPIHYPKKLLVTPDKNGKVYHFRHALAATVGGSLGASYLGYETVQAFKRKSPLIGLTLGAGSAALGVMGVHGVAHIKHSY
jgi:uncharacterized membrane protein